MPECPICLESMSPLAGNDEVFWLECCHPIHVSCKDALIKSTKKCICPVCKHETFIPELESNTNSDVNFNISITEPSYTPNIPNRILLIQPRSTKKCKNKLTPILIISGFIIVTAVTLLLILYI